MPTQSKQPQTKKWKLVTFTCRCWDWSCRLVLRSINFVLIFSFGLPGPSAPGLGKKEALKIILFFWFRVSCGPQASVVSVKSVIFRELCGTKGYWNSTLDLVYRPCTALIAVRLAPYSSHFFVTHTKGHRIRHGRCNHLWYWGPNLLV